MIELRTLAVVVALMALGAAAADPALAQGSATDRNTAEALSALAQAQPRARRRPPRIRVSPAYPYRLQSTDYPTPYPIEYPGPGAVRQCTSWLTKEFRPSGTVIVPQMRCWWVRG